MDLGQSLEPLSSRGKNLQLTLRRPVASLCVLLTNGSVLKGCLLRVFSQCLYTDGNAIPCHKISADVWALKLIQTRGYYLSTCDKQEQKISGIVCGSLLMRS